MIVKTLMDYSERTFNKTTLNEDHPGHHSGPGETNELTNDTIMEQLETTLQISGYGFEFRVKVGYVSHRTVLGIRW